MLRCPECGSSELKLREADSTPTIKWFNCENSHKFSRKTGWGQAAEFSGLVIAATVVTRLLLDHHGILDIIDDASGSF